MVAAALLACAFTASASVDVARERYQAYEQKIAERQEAAVRGDMEGYQARDAEARQSLVEARQAFEAGKAARSTDETVLMDYLVVLRALGDHDLAAEAADAAIDRGVESAALLRVLGESLLVTGPDNFQRGVDALRKSVALDGTSPASAQAWFALGRYYLENYLPDAAADAFAAALKADPEHVPSRLGEAAARVFSGEIAEAGAIIESVGRAAQPYDIELRSMMRTALYDFDVARRIFDDTADNHYAYARLLYLASRVPEAVLAARRATDLAPDRVEIWNFLGAVQLQISNYRDALASYEASLKLNPDQPGLQQTVEQLREVQQQQAAPPASGQGQAPLRGQGPLR
ncbi:MAG: tetratricopeptide repeat protein [Candidatus Hydrogenedentes bacterium]|nr:tetratricopeptide repeat protein [Candidatus Hydrogenedentota bacterium]